MYHSRRHRPWADVLVTSLVLVGSATARQRGRRVAGDNPCKAGGKEILGKPTKFVPPPGPPGMRGMGMGCSYEFERVMHLASASAAAVLPASGRRSCHNPCPRRQRRPRVAGDNRCKAGGREILGKPTK